MHLNVMGNVAALLVKKVSLSYPKRLISEETKVYLEAVAKATNKASDISLTNTITFLRQMTM